MGLNRRKSRKETQTSTGQSSPGRGLTTGDRKILKRYLKDYRDGARAVLFGQRAARFLSSAISPFKVAGRELPPLTLQVFQEPYLGFPKEFTAKQRRAIHEMCSDLGLYHTGIGSDRDNRYVAFSIYSDGLEYIPGFLEQVNRDANSQESTIEKLSKLKPWAKRQSSLSDGFDPVEATKNGREMIYKLIDQPGECLRDDVDYLDYEAILKEDLSHIFPPSFAPEEWMLVDTPERMRQCVRELEAANPTEIAFDLEGYNASKYVQMTCLIQLASNEGKEYVIDPLSPGMWEQVSLLGPLFVDPQIVKIGHSIGGMDVPCLHRDFGIFVNNAFDTYEAASCLHLPGKGLAKVCAHYGLSNSQVYEDLKATYQACDWTRRPLTEPMIRYGRYDVHYLIQLRRLMIRDLCKSELWDRENRDMEARRVRDSLASLMQNFDEDEEIFEDSYPSETDNSREVVESNTEAVDDSANTQTYYDASELRMSLDLMQAISKSQDRCLELWTDVVEPPLRNSDFQSLMMRCQVVGVSWSSSQLQLYEELAAWRETVANREECTGGWVCSLGVLALVALRRPTSHSGLKQITFTLPACLQPSSPAYSLELFALVRKSRVADGLQPEEDTLDYPSFSLLFSLREVRERRNILIFGGAVGVLGIGVAVLGVLGANRARR